MCCGSFPNVIGWDISRLKVGDEVVILAGEGCPTVERDTIDIVCSVNQFSALTAKGYALNCHTITRLVRTGHYFDDFIVSPEAKAILRNIKDNMDEYEVTPEPE